jgi:autotransporter-associated beta strand protein
LPASAASNTTNYWLGGGTSSQTVTASETANSLSISPGTAGQGLTINSAQTLGLTANVVSFDGTNYTYVINGPGQLGSSALVLTLNTAGSNALTIAAPISSGTGGLTVLGSGTTILTASNAASGGTTIGSGATLQLACGNYSAAISNSGSLVMNASGNYGGAISNNGALVMNASGNQTFSGVISGNGALEQLGSGVVSLAGSNTYSGLTDIVGGTLKLGSTAALAIRRVQTLVAALPWTSTA